ncbi:MAG: hypothetical protein AABZ60_18475 [Planctomycetota bacterium]
MKYLFLLVFCLSWNKAQNLLPYQIVSPDDPALLVKVYQTPKTKEWKAACLREEGVLWKISSFPHNGEKNYSYLSSDGRIFFQLKNEFKKNDEIVLRSWRNGEFLWEFSVQELSLPENAILEQPGKPNIWFETITQQKDTLEIQLNIPKKLNLSLVTGLPEKTNFLNRFCAQKGNDTLFSMIEGKKRPKEVSIESLLNHEGITDDYKKEVAKNIPTGVLKNTIPTFQTEGTLETNELYQQKITILHPDTLALYVLRFCDTVFTPEEMKKIVTFRYTVNSEVGYYLITVFPQLPYSLKFQKLINPKFREGTDPERVYQYLRISREGQILGCYFKKNK